jgi:iron complex transport system ATP-binding protein
MKLKVNDLTFSYSSTKILDGVTMEIDCSEMLGIVGPNGAGKSTLIRCINRILNPQEGNIIVDGKDIKRMTRMEIARCLGYVPQTASRAFSTTVFDTILMGRRPHCGWRCSNSDVKKTVEVLKLVGIENLAMRDFNELSGGQQQKVLVARALSQEADLLLLDEPTSNLDIRQQLETMEIIKNLVHDKGISAIMAIHDLNLAARYADQILMLKGGRIFDVGDPHTVLTAEKIGQVYGVEAVVKNEGGRPYIVPMGPIKNYDPIFKSL